MLEENRRSFEISLYHDGYGSFKLLTFRFKNTHMVNQLLTLWKMPKTFRLYGVWRIFVIHSIFLHGFHLRYCSYGRSQVRVWSKMGAPFESCTLFFLLQGFSHRVFLGKVFMEAVSFGLLYSLYIPVGLAWRHLYWVFHIGVLVSCIQLVFAIILWACHKRFSGCSSFFAWG